MNDSAKVTRAQEYLSKLVQSGAIPGIQYVIVSEHETLFEAYLGVQDVASGRLVTSDMTFMASSVTKTLTAAAILQLNESGQVKLSESLSSYFSEHPYGNEVRINQLLNQSSGIPNPMPLRWLHLVTDHGNYDEPACLRLTLKQHCKLSFSPGDKYAYSNISYWLLGKVVEQVSQMTFASYMRQRVFEPLGISEDEMSYTIPNLDKHACGHVRLRSMIGLIMPLMMNKEHFTSSAAGRRRFKPVLMNGLAYGGLIGTAQAFGRFLQDQLRDDSVLFATKSKNLFFSDQYDKRGRLLPTTLGWHRGSVNGIDYYGKPGDGPGFQSNIRLYPGIKIASAWLANEAAASEVHINALSNAVDSYFL